MSKVSNRDVLVGCGTRYYSQPCGPKRKKRPIACYISSILKDFQDRVEGGHQECVRDWSWRSQGSKTLSLSLGVTGMDKLRKENIRGTARSTWDVPELESERPHWDAVMGVCVVVSITTQTIPLANETKEMTFMNEPSSRALWRHQDV